MDTQLDQCTIVGTTIVIFVLFLCQTIHILLLSISISSSSTASTSIIIIGIPCWSLLPIGHHGPFKVTIAFDLVGRGEDGFVQQLILSRLVLFIVLVVVMVGGTQGEP